MKNLKDLMIEKNINQSFLAKQINVTQRSISGWLLNQNEPSESCLIKLADYFNCSIDYLVGREESQSLFRTSGIMPDITAEEKEFILIFRKLSERRKKTIINLIKEMEESSQEKKYI